MKSDYRLRAEKFIAEIYPYICEFPSNKRYYRLATSRFNDEHRNRCVECANGAVRIALITSDYVVKFDYSPEGIEDYGGCADEFDFYQFAVEMGFEHLFAEVTPFMYEGHMFYIMPRIRGVGRYDDRYAEEFMNEDDANFIRHFLNDTHSGNYGWKNKYPVIIDYAFSDEVYKRRWE